MLCRIQPSNNCTCFECMTIVQSVGSSNKVNFEYGIPLQTYLSFEKLARSLARSLHGRCGRKKYGIFAFGFTPTVRASIL